VGHELLAIAFFMAQNRDGNGLAELEKRLWAAADQLWVNSSLRPSEYSTPVLGLIFLRFADNAFTKAEAELRGKSTGRRAIGKLDYQAKGVVYLPDEARFSRLPERPWTARFILQDRMVSARCLPVSADSGSPPEQHLLRGREMNCRRTDL